MSSDRKNKTQKDKLKQQSEKVEKESLKSEEHQDNQERSGVIPEGLDFKKFMGCGG